MTKGEKIKAALLEISPREEVVIRKYYGLTATEGIHTLKRIGEHLWLTKERIRQIKEKAIRKIATTCKYKPDTVRRWLDKQRKGGKGDG